MSTNFVGYKGYEAHCEVTTGYRGNKLIQKCDWIYENQLVLKPKDKYWEKPVLII